MAYDDGFYYGQCKLICTAATNMEGKIVTAISVDGSSAATSGSITDGKCVLTVPGRALYKVEVTEGSTKLFSKEVECGYGDCIVVYLAEGYDTLKQNDLLSLENIESDASLDYKAASAQAVKDVVTDKLGGCTLSVVDGEFYIAGADSVPKKLGKLTPDIIRVAGYRRSDGVGGNIAQIDFDISDFTKFKYAGTNASSIIVSKNMDGTATVNITKPSDEWIDISEYVWMRLSGTGITGLEWSSATE